MIKTKNIGIKFQKVLRNRGEEGQRSVTKPKICVTELIISPLLVITFGISTYQNMRIG